MKGKLILFCCLLITQASYSYEGIKKLRVKYKPLHFGLFFHYLNGLQNTKMPWNEGKVTSWNECLNDLNVDKLAEQVKQIGADYVIITTGQIDKYLCFPNTTYEELTGYQRGEATSNRDLIADLYKALNKRNIKLFLYATGDGPRADSKASLALNNPSIKMAINNGKFLVDSAWVTNWSKVIKSISLQYGRKITGWWFDGSYDFIGYNDLLLSNYYKAAKTGNSSALVAFNFNGPRDLVKITTVGNYTAGESDKFKDFPTVGFKTSKVKWHVLSYLGTAWAQPGINYSADYMSSYIRKVRSLNGMVTIDVCLLRNGAIEPEQYKFLKSLDLKH